MLLQPAGTRMAKVAEFELTTEEGEPGPRALQFLLGTRKTQVVNNTKKRCEANSDKAMSPTSKKSSK